MTTVITIGLVISIIAIISFALIGSKTSSGGEGILSLPRLKIPTWLTGWFNWGGFTTIVLLLVLGYFGYSGYQYFFHGEENKVHIARAEIGDAGMVFFTIPKIGPEFENKIIFDKAWGFRFSEGNASINFPRATLFQFNERNGEAGARFFTNVIGIGSTKRPTEKFRGSIKGGQPGIPKNVALIRSGSELRLQSRAEQMLFVPKGAILGDFPHVKYRLKLKKK
ncbi:hypothetical protein HN784_01405 [bacterium]|jgi:hypothetical protein|nr:hypothetical protein [bacterium]MBT4250923.1 hypothetical protein [bacterium]MBT4597889.1 hypothetical protein [bacterium]MBT6753919.1 hypothetical protein [bacterium]MBT7037348.1 hypothetical protein [bacterium]